jgi:hypothetical protein
MYRSLLIASGVGITALIEGFADFVIFVPFCGEKYFWQSYMKLSQEKNSEPREGTWLVKH